MDERLQAELVRPHFLEVGPNASPSDLESYLNQVGIEDRRAASAYVFRVLATQLQALCAGDAKLAIAELLQKASEVPVFVLSLDGGHQLHRIDATGVSRIAGTAEERALNDLRAIDLEDVVEDAKDLCFFNATPSQHFVAPSGEHCEAFFRLGDAIRSKRALDRLVFWTTPVLASAGGVIVDNWSIASLALRALQQANRNTPFDCLAVHPGQNRRDAELIISRMIKDELAPNTTLVFLVSVTSSGSYAAIVREIARDYLPEDQIKVIAMYGLSDTPESVDRLCTLDFTPKNYHPDQCVLCKSNTSRPIPVDPGLYYLKAYPENPVMLRKEHFAQRDFIDRYHSVPEIFSVHRDDRLRRHHAFHVNVRAMLTGSPDFERRCEGALTKLYGSVDLLITPADDVSQLGELAKQKLGIPRIATDSLRNLSEVDSEFLIRSRRILIVDDVLVSGSRIEGYVKALREQANKPEAVNILVGLGRPPSPDALLRHETAWTRNVPWDAKLVVVEQFFLPDWEAAECPWCHEFEFLSRAAESVAEPPQWLTDRIRRLIEREQGGVRESPLLLLPNVIERSLGHGSLVGQVGISAMASLFSVASALQFLRNDTKVGHKLEAGFPLYQVMAARNLRNYSESLLRAVLLRVVAPREWGVTEKQHLKQLLLEVCPAGDDADLISGEVLVAISRGILDRSALATLGPLFKKQLPQSDVLLGVLTAPDLRDDVRVGEREKEERPPKRSWWLPFLIVLFVLVGVSLVWSLR